MKAWLVLDNGDIYEGESFGYETESTGEVVFNTSMAGYQEILTDPSYTRQIITMTYPMIGNYGISPENMESDGIKASGIIVKEYVDRPSNFSSRETLSEFLKKYKIPGISGIDTRKLTRYIRDNGAPNGGIFIAEKYNDSFLEKVRAFPGIKGMDLASVVSTKEPYAYGNHAGKEIRLAVFDFGVKTNILRLLDKAGFAVTVFPAKTSPESVLKDYHAFFLSNGPGDPEPLDYAINTAKDIIGSGKQMFGICLGHQITGLASGNKTWKMKFGHRGGNQPVLNHATGRVEITSQNHGFAVEDGGSSPVSHVNLNDNTIEGFNRDNIMTVQYHPESSPGPHDSEYLFDEFYQRVRASLA